MLQIQKASAGSGKTFTLAKKFIFFLIAYKDNRNVWHLRKASQIEDILPRILAITFTNKATNEMKQRIIDKLANLAMAADEKNLTPEYIETTDYLKDFSGKLNVSYQKIGEACKIALKSIINNYSLFKISTIDAFFQEILRTFTVEANINDSYQLEIDSDFIGKAAIDTTLNELDSNINNPAASFWLKILIENVSQKSQKWNVFNKSDSRNSIYFDIKNALKQLENENFKSRRDELIKYFNDDESGIKLKKLYQDLKKDFTEEKSRLLKNIKSNLEQLESIKTAENIPQEAFNKNSLKQLVKIEALSLDSNKSPVTTSDDNSQKSFFLKKYKNESTEKYDSVIKKIFDDLYLWEHSDKITGWKVYGELLPYFGIILEINNKIGEILENANLIRLSDTNSILKKIIGEEDAPFVYERLGNYIDNFLIDEFQDTSAMQWEILKPLLGEGVAKDLDSLIIGDPKQSIYRFRNADYTLINEKVPETFPDHKAAGTSKEENTNWRSSRLIVEFNNLFFYILAKKISLISSEKGNTLNFSELYGNVIQHPHKKEEKGYVEIRFFENEQDEFSSQDEDDTDFENLAIEQIGPLVSNLMFRGYRQKDIGILVNKNIQGKNIIEALVNYNRTLRPDEKPIEFISEESLLISSSSAVEMIISVIEKISDGGFIVNENLIRNDHQKDKKFTKIPWNKIKVNFYYYSLNHPELSTTDLVLSYLNDNETDETLHSLIADMQSPTLPAIVEAIIATFLPSEIRSSQAIFIAAFQDLVLEYCERFSSDPASFMEWWKSKGSNRAVTSPEDMDAVQIMTIHKSKGLEFKCVIVPFASDSMIPSYFKTEWRWVRPSLNPEKYPDIPPVLPVKTVPGLRSTPHESVYKTYYDEVMMDRLNNYYVAFTRAVEELYIFAQKPAPKSSGVTINKFLFNICKEMEEETDLEGREESEWVIDLIHRNISEDETIITFGHKIDPKDSKSKESDHKLKTKTNPTEFLLNDYYVNDSLPILHYVESESPQSGNEIDQEEDTDPRSEGNLLHAIMSNIRTSKDIDFAINYAKSRGWVSLSQASHYRDFVLSKIENKEVKAWFDGSWRVLNERSIFSEGKSKRPDRIMFSPGNKEVVIVDYKFGSSENQELVKRYRRQIKNYIRLLSKSGSFDKISGFLWFVKEDKFLRIEEGE